MRIRNFCHVKYMRQNHFHIRKRCRILAYRSLLNEQQPPLLNSIRTRIFCGFRPNNGVHAESSNWNKKNAVSTHLRANKARRSAAHQELSLDQIESKCWIWKSNELHDEGSVILLYHPDVTFRKVAVNCMWKAQSPRQINQYIEHI